MVPLIIGWSGAFSAAAPAQSVPPGAQDPGGGGLGGTLSHTDLERLGGDRTDHEKSALARANARSQSGELAAALNFACEVRDAERVGTRRVTANGKEIEAYVYEVACGNGSGYILMSQGSQKPMGISCLAADAARAADQAAGRKPDLVCGLAENKDVKTIAASLMATAGTPCAIRDFRWFGKSAATQLEYSEVVCSDGKGYLLQTAMPGSTAQTHVITCADAARQGLQCRLSERDGVDGPQLTVQTLKDALVAHGVTCPIDELRVAGKEHTRQRYVVEYRCAGQAQAIVAYIPLAGNANPYESMDCAAALARKVVCELTPRP